MHTQPDIEVYATSVGHEECLGIEYEDALCRYELNVWCG